MNGYGTEDGAPAVNNLLHRSDLPPTNNPDNDAAFVPPDFGVPCANPISSIQAQYGSIMYPSNAIDTQCDGGENTLLLKTDELYNEIQDNPGLRFLLSATKDLGKDDLEYVINLIKRLRNPEIDSNDVSTCLSLDDFGITKED